MRFWDDRVLYIDGEAIVIDKPAGLAVHPGARTRESLEDFLHQLRFGFHRLPLPVHRLDRDTSGLMVVARTRAAMDALVALIAAREVTRQYLAMAHRPWQGAAARHVDAPIGRDPRNRLRMAVVDLQRHSGKTARTLIERVDDAAEGCLVRCTLETGRTHQIRVHMASIGHPLVGDALYGGAPAAGMQRQALHAFRLAFVHPVTKQPMAFDSPLPPDMARALTAWGLHYNLR